MWFACWVDISFHKQWTHLTRNDRYSSLLLPSSSSSSLRLLLQITLQLLALSLLKLSAFRGFLGSIRVCLLLNFVCSIQPYLTIRIIWFDATKTRKHPNAKSNNIFTKRLTGLLAEAHKHLSFAVSIVLRFHSVFGFWHNRQSFGRYLDLNVILLLSFASPTDDISMQTHYE